MPVIKMLFLNNETFDEHFLMLNYSQQNTEAIRGLILMYQTSQIISLINFQVTTGTGYIKIIQVPQITRNV